MSQSGIAEDCGRWNVCGSLCALGGGGVLMDLAGVSAGLWQVQSSPRSCFLTD